MPLPNSELTSSFHSALVFLIRRVGLTFEFTRYVGLLYQPRMTDESGAVGGMRIGWENLSTRTKPGPMPLHPPQISHVLTGDRTRAAAV
jgi:hypothetical protein